MYVCTRAWNRTFCSSTHINTRALWFSEAFELFKRRVFIFSRRVKQTTSIKSLRFSHLALLGKLASIIINVETIANILHLFFETNQIKKNMNHIFILFDSYNNWEWEVNSISIRYETNPYMIHEEKAILCDTSAYDTRKDRPQNF